MYTAAAGAEAPKVSSEILSCASLPHPKLYIGGERSVKA